jgi:hypothetical protein
MEILFCLGPWLVGLRGLVFIARIGRNARGVWVGRRRHEKHVKAVAGNEVGAQPPGQPVDGARRKWTT